LAGLHRAVIITAMRDSRALQVRLCKLRRKKVLVSALAVFVLAVGIGRVVQALDELELVVERIEGSGWSAEGITLDLSLLREQSAATATISRISLPGQTQALRLRTARIACLKLELGEEKIGCADAELSLSIPGLGEQDFRGRVAYDRGSGGIDFDIHAPRFAGGSVRIRGALGERDWHAKADVQKLEIEQALKIAQILKIQLPSITGSGRLTAQIDVTGQEQLQRAAIVANVAELTVNNESGTLASDKLTFATRATITAEEEDWIYDVELDAVSGQAYAQPVFIDLALHAFRLRSNGRVGAKGQLIAEHFEIDHSDVLRAQGRARVDTKHAQPLRDLTLDLQMLQFPGAYSSYLQPFLIDTDFKQLTTSGRMSGRAQIENGVPQNVALKIADVSFDDGTRTFLLNGLNGEVTWREGEDEDEDVVLRGGAERSRLSWRGGSLLNLALGPAQLDFATIGRNFRLLEPARIPLLDGSIELESLRIRNAGLPTVAFMVDATVHPISVAQLCRAFGWPEFGGSVGGAISKLRLRDGVVTLGTTLEARVFDGRVAIKDLRLEDTLGKWPKFYSSIELANLDLELVTRAFSFGRITGRLSGGINDLQLFNWQPVAFEAALYTPQDDRSKHRISQRAVENIGSIGGGGAGITQALSSGFLRFFDEFRYDRLGFSCRLENEVCHMNGVAPAPNGGYYLVKGSGVPRIDVIGGARRVDWPRLVQQLIAISESEGPVVE
jgi:hypothetical protein